MSLILKVQESERNCTEEAFTELADLSPLHPCNRPVFAPALRFRGGCASGDDDSGSDGSDSAEFECESDAAETSVKRKRKPAVQWPWKSTHEGKGKARAISVKTGIRVTIGKGRNNGMYVDEVIHLDHALECCLPWFKPDVWGLFYMFCCNPRLSSGFERWDDNSDDLISAPIRAAKSAESRSLIAIATEFYQSVVSKHCKAKEAGNEIACGGHAIMRKFSEGPSNGKSYFIGCSNWSKNDDRMFAVCLRTVHTYSGVAAPLSSRRLVYSSRYVRPVRRPELVALTLDASWIMVDTTFVVVHGKTNEWKLLIWLNGLDKRTVIGRVWSNRATRGSFVLVWNGTFEAIAKITGKELNFKVFSKKSNLLGAIGDSEGPQAQALGDVIILRRLNLLEVNGTPTVDVDTILTFIWKTCIVHFNRGVFGLEAYADDYIFQYLLLFPYLDTDEEIAEYSTFCNTSTSSKLKAWWAHKLSYPWLLPSLNRHLRNTDKDFFALTPWDSNPIEGSHAQDNQVNGTNRTLMEAIVLSRKLDSDTARIIKASIESGVWANGNNSIRSRFTSQAARRSRAHAKQAEAAK
ncbi:hypothetical protein C8J57DRAFT_1250974 [Mycena rebaudengoi]|nr:hypothetical protein C8J57DRAFT_1250974 [Mycena rebaudengoi]